MSHKERDHAIDEPRLGVRGLLRALRGYVIGRSRGRERLRDAVSLARFIDSRSSHVAQTALYGYLRTRAGTRFPELFENDAYLASINIAKWQIWLACVSDLGVFTGGRLAAADSGANVAPVMRSVLGLVLDPIALPPDAGDGYERARERVHRRFDGCAYAGVADDESAFTESPAALVEWAPIIDSLKALDEEIIRNSVRFRWQEVRRALRRDLEPVAILAAAER